MDSCGPEERSGRGMSPGRQDFEMAGERGIQDDTWENWADGGIISEFKRATEPVHQSTQRRCIIYRR